MSPTLTTITSSVDQTRDCLTYMMKFINQYKADPHFVELARNAVQYADGPQEEAEAIRQWVKASITYRCDPQGIQWLQSPPQTLSIASGNCDCMATLAGTLLAALGHSMAPLGVCWTGDPSPTHAVVFDLTAECYVDPVASVPCDQWPEPGWTLEKLVTAWGM